MYISLDSNACLLWPWPLSWGLWEVECPLYVVLWAHTISIFPLPMGLTSGKGRHKYEGTAQKSCSCVSLSQYCHYSLFYARGQGENLRPSPRRHNPTVAWGKWWLTHWASLLRWIWSIMCLTHSWPQHPRIIFFVCSDFWGFQQKPEHCSDFEICWKKWTLPNDTILEYTEGPGSLTGTLQSILKKKVISKRSTGDLLIW